MTVTKQYGNISHPTTKKTSQITLCLCMDTFPQHTRRMRGRLSLQQSKHSLFQLQRVFFTAAWGDPARSQKIALLCWRPVFFPITLTKQSEGHHHIWPFLLSPLVMARFGPPSLGAHSTGMAFYSFTAAASTKHACLSLQRGNTANGNTAGQYSKR